MAKLTEVSSRTIAESTKSTENSEIRASLMRVSERPAASSNFEVRLRCPFCAEETFLGDRFCQECGSIQPAFADEKFSLVDKAKELLSTRKQVVAAVLVASIISGVAFYAIFTSLSLPGEVEKCLQENRLNDAVRLSEQLYVARFGSLTGKDAELYSTAFYRRAQVFGANNNAKGALVDLARVLPGYSQKADVDKLSQLFSVSLMSNKNIPVDSSSPKIVLPGTAAGVLPQSNLKLRSTNQSIGQTNTAKNSQTGKAVQEEGTDNKGATASSETATTDGSDDDDAKEEKEMAHYNNMLAEYFSKKKQSDATPGTSEKLKEPPSFNEWIQSGRTEF